MSQSLLIPCNATAIIAIKISMIAIEVIISTSVKLAQLDRFLFKHVLQYPTEAEELSIVASHGTRTGMTTPAMLGLAPVTGRDMVTAAIAAVSQARLAEPIAGYVVSLVRATRATPDISNGASPRSAAMLAVAARARAALDGRDYVIPDDVKALALPALRHRVLLSPAAEIDGRRVDEVLAALVETIPVPR